MTTRNTVKPVLLTCEQMEAIRKIQEEERKRSGLGIAPTIHAIARQLMDEALNIHDKIKVTA